MSSALEEEHPFPESKLGIRKTIFTKSSQFNFGDHHAS
jgi:hypothetical protein